ncbi:MAG: GGDEF domain-containing protein, partial [bacterium]
LPGVDRELAAQTRERIQDAFDDEPITYIEGEPVQVGISIGFALFPEDELEPELLITAADRRMYKNKLERAESREPGVSVVPFDRLRD